MTSRSLISDIDANLFFQISNFGLTKLNGFKIQELLDALNIHADSWQYSVVRLHCYNAIQSGNTIYFNPTNIAILPNFDSIFHIISEQPNGTSSRNLDIYLYTYILKSSIIFEYLDFLEFREATKNAEVSLEKANESINIAYKSISIARISMGITFFSVLVTLVFSYYTFCKTTNLSQNQIDIANKQLELSKNPIKIDSVQLNEILLKYDSLNPLNNKSLNYLSKDQHK
jgi:hypothetical protein